MHVENVSVETLRGASDAEVRNLRHRFIELYAGFYAKNPNARVGDLTESEFVGRYRLLRDEMGRRDMRILTETPLDRILKDSTVRKAIWGGLDVRSLGDVVAVENFVAVGGSFIKDPKTAADLDVIIRQPEEQRDQGLELKLSRLLGRETGKDCHFVYAERGPHSSFLPLFDLVLRSRPHNRIEEVEESSKVRKKLSAADQADYDAETAQIRESAKTPEARGVHKFKPARWTYANGHPRCKVCGQEETITGLCNKKPTKADVEANRERIEDFGLDADQIKESLNKASLSVGRAFTPLKTSGGYGKLEFADVDPLWTTWAQGYIPDPGVAVETKYDGFRVSVHKAGTEVWIFSEDAKRNLVDRLADVAAEVKSYEGTFVLDGELLLWTPDGKKIERKDMPSYIMAEKAPAFRATVECFDCLYLGSRRIDDKPWMDRQVALSLVFGGVDEKLLHRVRPTICKTKDSFLAAVRKHAAEAHSEGAMCKVTSSDYPLNGATSEWAKFKNFKELRVRVVGVEAKGDNGWIYECRLADGEPIGRTYATKIQASKGDILEVAVAEVKVGVSGEQKFSWDNPIVRSKKPAGTALTTPAQAEVLSRVGRTVTKAGTIDFGEGDSGSGVAQLHVMGLSEEEAGKLREVGGRAKVAAWNPARLREILIGAIGNHGAHVDMRLRRGSENTWQGNEVFVGNLDGLDKLEKLHQEGQSLRSEWKAPHKGEPGGDVIEGGLGWMEAGARGPELFKPGDPGATTNEWGAMLRIDRFTWRLYAASGGTEDRPHAFKFNFKGGRYFEGNFLWAWVPVSGERVWMVRRLADDDDEKPAETGGVEKADGEEPAPFFRFTKVEKKKKIVGGVVYEPGSKANTDTQREFARADEIEKAMERFMLRYAVNQRLIKVMHRGQTHFFPILECFQAEEDTRKGTDVLRKGAWWLSIKITNDDVWTEVEEGRLTGFSMGGRASTPQ